MMSSRSGNIISYEDLKEEALRKTTEEIVKRGTLIGVKIKIATGIQGLGFWST
jgi:arginyl-tRNA synthetase